MQDNRDVVSTAEQDFLDQDPPIRGQKYVCLSFLSPDDVLKKKDAYFFEKYLSHFSSELSELWSSMLDVHKDNIDFTDSLRSIRNRYEHLFNVNVIGNDFNYYVTGDAEKLEGEFFEANNFQTTMRGLKVRGSYDSLREAQVRAQVLKRIDDKFNVFIAEVGCWCPWSPNPSEIENQEFAETELNTLMKKYQENQLDKDEFYNSRKERLKQETRPNKQQPEVTEETDIVKNLEMLNDPWEEHKKSG